MNKSKENGKKESRMVTVEGLIVKIRPDSRSKRKYGVYLEDADDGERTWYDYWKDSSREALPPGLEEDRRVRLEVKVSEGDKGATFRDIQRVEPLDVDGGDAGPDQRSDSGGRHADRDVQRRAAPGRLPPMELTVQGYEAVRVTASDDDGPPAVYGRGLAGKQVLVVLLEPLDGDTDD